MYRVIIVDDEALVRKGLRETIEWDALDLEISGEACNGSEALDLIRTVRPDILITDIKMPVMDGLELIRQIKNLELKIKIIILSGFSDYKFLKEAINYGVESYLLKPIDNDELISILKSMVNKIEKEIYSALQHQEGILVLKNNTLNRLITNMISEKELKEKALLLDIKLGGNQFQVAVAEIDETEQDTSLEYNSQPNTLKVLNVCEEFIGNTGLEVVFTNLTGKVVFLFSNSGYPLELKGIKSILLEIIKAINQYMELSISIGVGYRVESMEEVYKSYKSALKCLDYGFAVENEGIILHDYIDEIKTNLSSTNLVNFQLIENYIRFGKRKELIIYIEEFFNEFIRSKNVSVGNIRNMVIQTVFHIVKILDVINQESSKTTKKLEVNYEDILSFKKYEDFKFWLRSFCERAMDTTMNNVHRNTCKYVKDTIDFIGDNYNQDISLKLVSDKIYVNASYLGQIFKKEIGESFTDYVNNYRIQKAKELLTTTNMKVYEISLKVGFTDTHYFIKIFKKYTGMNPSEIKRIG
jgi:two-component system, response regulator YesN